MPSLTFSSALISSTTGLLLARRYQRDGAPVQRLFARVTLKDFIETRDRKKSLQHPGYFTPECRFPFSEKQCYSLVGLLDYDVGTNSNLDGI